MRMPKLPKRPKELTGKIFRGEYALRRGLLTRADLRSSAWQPVFRGVYADRRTVITHRLKCVAASTYLLPDRAAIAGRSAAWIYGASSGRDCDPVEVLTPKAFGPMRGLAIHHGPLSVEDTRRIGRMVVTTPARTCWDMARWLDAVETVVILDLLISKRVVSVAELIAYAQARSGKPGWGRLLKAAQLADAGAESPQESRLRVGLVMAGLPRPVTQYVISHSGRFVARVDLGWPELKIALEYDGVWHADRGQLERDRARLNRLIGADWLVLHVTAQRMKDDFDGLVREIRMAMRSRRRVVRV